MLQQFVWLNVVVCGFLAGTTLFIARRASRTKTEGGRATFAVCACVLVGLAATALASSLMKVASHHARAGWEVHPVIIAADEIPAGTVLTYDMISQRAFPDQFVVASDVTPDRASEVIGRPVIAALKAGDILTWAFLGEGVSEATCQNLQH
jgi:Flp pilus assembly protein CpaB